MKHKKTWKACICAMNVVDGYECYQWLYGSYADLHKLWTPPMLEFFSCSEVISVDTSSSFL